MRIAGFAPPALMDHGKCANISSQERSKRCVMETLKIEPALKADLLLAAVRHKRTPEELAHEILREYLDLDKEAAAGLLESDRAWAEFEKTGEGLPLEEAAAWLTSWGSSDPKPGPECRKL